MIGLSMTMMLIAAVIGLLLIAAVLGPFFYGPGGRLQAGSAVVSPEQLASQKQALVQQFLADEKDFQNGLLTAREWKARQNFILGRFTDASRRLDYLNFVKKISTGLLVVLLWGGIGAPSGAAAESATGRIFLGERHLVMLKPGIDTVWGTVIFAVVNEGAVPRKSKFYIMVPKETVDFAAQEGVLPAELQQDAAGLLFVEKEFAPGTNVVGVGFTISAKSGDAKVTFTGPPGDARQVAILSSPGFLTLSGMGIRRAGAEEGLPATGYEQYFFDKPLAADDVVAVAVSGIPEGRRNFWVMGGGVAGIIFLLGGALAIKTKEQA